MTYIYENYEEKTNRKSRKKKVKRALIGLLLLGLAGVMITNKLGILTIATEGLSVFGILLSVIFFALLIDGLFDRSFGQIIFSIAFLIIINDKLLGLEEITPWPVLGAALLGTIGLNMLFPGFKRKYKHVYEEMTEEEFEKSEFADKRTVSEETREGDKVFFKNTFGSSVKYLRGEVEQVNVVSSFGAFELYFSDAILKNNAARLRINSSFGEVKLYIPADWNVVISANSSFGQIDENGHCNINGSQVLYIDGAVAFGNMKILYV